MKDHSPTAKEFYDEMWSSQRTIDEDKEILSMRSESIEYSYRRAEPLGGKKLLEIGCGAGFQTVEFAKRGALVTAIDFSESSVKNTKLLIAKQDRSADVRRMNAESLDFPDGSFDIIYINSVLMHADKKKILRECSRVLRQGGRVIIVEPLSHNPFLLPYRLFFSPYKKTNPNYMSLSLFRKYLEFFSKMRHKEFYFFYVLALPLRNRKSFRLLKKLIANADQALLKTVPFLRNLCWVSVVEYEK